MKHLFLATALLASGLSLSAQTPVTPPFNYDGSSCINAVAFPSSTLPAFSCDEEGGYSIYNDSLNKLFSLSASGSDKLICIECLDCSSALGTDLDEGGESHNFTQTLFNDDDAFEYFMADDYNSEMGYCSKISLRTSASKDPIFVIEEGNGLSSGVISIIYFGKNRPIYMIIDGRYNEEYERPIYWYKYEPKTGAVEKVAAENVPALVARPNPVKAGEVVNLDLKGVYDQCNVALFTMRGELVKTLTTTDGTLNTSGLTPGHYLYKVAGNGRQVGTGKLIIK